LGESRSFFKVLDSTLHFCHRSSGCNNTRRGSFFNQRNSPNGGSMLTSKSALIAAASLSLIGAVAALNGAAQANVDANTGIKATATVQASQAAAVSTELPLSASVDVNAAADLGLGLNVDTEEIDVDLGAGAAEAGGLSLSLDTILQTAEGLLGK
jgi:hypothetical protein